MKSIKALLLVILSGVLAANGQSKKTQTKAAPLFKTDPVTGVQYRIIKHNKDAPKPTDEDFAFVVMVYKNERDSTLLNTHLRGGDSTGTMMQAIPLKKTFNGCLEQGILMMAKGDSAVFRVNADSLFLKTFHAPPGKLPPSITSKTFYTFYIKLTRFATKDEIMAEQNKLVQKQQAEAQGRKNQESADVAAYISKNYPGIKPNADSLFILTHSSGTGKQIMDGDSVEMSYILSNLDGKVLQKSGLTRGSGFKFIYTKNVALIQGWLKLLPTLHDGDKVKVLIPSSMAYGARGAGQDIPGFTPLIFDLEVLHVGSNK